MKLNCTKPFHYEEDMDADGIVILWRVLDTFDALLCICLTEPAAKETIERLNESN